jgi:hypothetical protein
MLKIYTSNDFAGIWPVGTSAVVIAENEEEAIQYLADELKDRKLPQAEFTIAELDTNTPGVLILQSGDY